MECNKEEALRAKNLAEERMMACDYIGAKKFVTKAQILFPDLENIPQMMATCEVHMSANKKINGLDDWYGVLQVQPSSDVETIRKQYRKFALLLHPDKNKFSGAEAAFKLVGEGYRLLSDRIKRSQYDVRYRSHSMFATRHLNANSARNRAAGDNVPENIRSVHTFWTCCKNCGHRYKYLKCYINTVMHCSTCKKSYIACNMRDDEVPPSSSTVGKKEFQDQRVNNTSQQNASIRSESGSSAAEMDKKNGTVRGNLNKMNQENQEKNCGNRKPKKGEGFVKKNAAGGNPQKCETSTNNSALKKNQAAKKRTKAVEESSKNSEVDSSAVRGAKTDTNGSNKSSLSRKKPQVSNSKGESDGDFVSPPTKRTKSGCEFESDPNTKQTTKDNKSPEVADSGVSPALSHAYKEKSKKCVKSGNEDILLAKNKGSEGRDGNQEDADFSTKFNLFEDERKIDNFAVNQVWSIRDSRDGMPRKYVRIKKVWNDVFKLRITNLEPVQSKNDIPVACGKFKNGKTVEVEDRSIFSSQMRRISYNRIDIIYPRKGEIWALFRDWKEDWSISLENHELPYKYDVVEVVSDFNDEVGVGVAYLGKLEGFVSRFHRKAQRGVYQIQFTPNDILRFSHKVPAVKMTGKEKECAPADSYELDLDALPKEVFQVDAVDMAMDSEILKGKADVTYPEPPKTAPSSRKRRKSDCDNGICSNLGEAQGEPSRKYNVSPCQVDEMNSLNETRKSCEAADVVKLRKSPRKRLKSDDNNGMCGNLGEAEGEPSRKHNVSPCQVDEMNPLNETRKSCEVADVIKLRKSPRLQTIPSHLRVEKKTTEQGSKMDTPKHLVTDSLEIRKSSNGIHRAAEIQEGDSSKKQRLNGELPSLSKQNDLPIQLDGSANESPETVHVSSSCKTPRRNAFDFKNQKSKETFRVNQVWAIYSSDKRLLFEYVQIKKIETKHKFVLRAIPVEPYPPPTEPVTSPVSCGEFKLKLGRPEIISQDSFSHLVRPVHIGKNIVKVYPLKGEIWVLYRDNTKEEHDIVEVLEEYGDGQVAKAVALTANGSNSLYIVPRKHGSVGGFIHIPKAEMSRFSHRIPAVKHEKKKTRLVEGGYWELDSTAIPRCTVELE